MGGCHIWCKHKEIKTYRCYFLCSVVLQYIFFYFCCLNERNIVVLIFHHQRPLDFLPLCMKQVDAAYFFFFFLLLFFSSGFCMLFPHTHTLTDPRSVTVVSVSCFCGPHKNRWDEEQMLWWRCRLCVSLQRCCIVLQGSWMQHQNWWIDTRWRRGQRGLNASAKVFICRKVGHQSSLTSAVLQSPKKMPVALIFHSIAIARLFSLRTLCAYDH